MRKAQFFCEVFPSYMLVFVLIFVGCDSSMSNEDERQIDDLENNDYLSINEIKRDAQAYFYCENIEANQAVSSFQRKYTCTNGQHFIEANQLQINLLKLKDRIDLALTINVSNLGAYPTVYNSSFSENEIADHLKTVLTVKNSQNNKTFQLSESESIDSQGDVRYQWSFYPADLKAIKEGLVNFEVSIESRYCSFFGVQSKVYPLQAKIQFQYYVPTIYESTLYFNGLVLNEKKAKQILGNNDWNNSTPETGIIISCNNQTIIYSYTKNSFSNSKKETAKIYHTSELDSIRIKVVDVDYGLNGNDLISDTLLSIRSLEGETYFDLPLKAVDKLLVYTQSKGRVN